MPIITKNFSHSLGHPNIFRRNIYHFTIAAVPRKCITLGWQQQHQEYYISLQTRAKMFNPELEYAQRFCSHRNSKIYIKNNEIFGEY
jgi:hypothetical protein